MNENDHTIDIDGRPHDLLLVFKPHTGQCKPPIAPNVLAASFAWLRVVVREGSNNAHHNSAWFQQEDQVPRRLSDRRVFMWKDGRLILSFTFAMIC